MLVLDVIDAVAARRWATMALIALGQAREEIDALNVYPVPDGDTGTNLYLTFESACAAVTALAEDAPLGRVAEEFARGALFGARGNSGVIMAQLLRGWADVLVEDQVMDAGAVRRAFRRADTSAWAAVSDPVEGTILSVSRAAAHAAADAGPGLQQVVSSAVRAASEALARTPEQLEVLARAGVVDAGGRGLVVLLQALEDVVRGHRSNGRTRSHRTPALPGVHVARCVELDGAGPAYEVMYLLDATPEAVAVLRRRLAPLGDSLVIVGSSGLWNVHVHVDDPGAAVEAGIEAGRPYRVRIAHFAEQVARAGGAPHLPDRGRGEPLAPVGLVACAAGPGLAALFAEAGAVVVRGEPGRRPSTGLLLDAVRRAHAEAVVLLPNDPATQTAAEAAAAAARREGIRVTVLPTRAQVQGLSAAAVHDPVRGFDDDVVRMSTAAGATRDGAVTVAARDAITMAGPCRAGDALGVVQGDFAVVGDDLTAVAVEVIDRLLSGGGELLTLVTGAEADERTVGTVREHVRNRRRDVEVQVLDGGQARYPLLIGVE